MDSKLSPELWIMIASLILDTKDLSHLGRTSRRLLQILRPVLYEETILRDKAFEVSTVTLLARDPVLASYVKSFRYVRNVYGTIEAFFNMSNLTNLEIALSFEDNPEAQQSVVDHFTTREKLAMYRTTFASDDFGIPGLRNLEWYIDTREPSGLCPIYAY